MIKKTFIFSLLCLSLALSGQTITKKLLTTKYAGTYSYGDIEKSGIGTIYIYPETDSSILFYIDLNRGAPSYNMGSEYGRIKIINGKGTYYTKESGEEIGCKWNIQFIKNTIIIKTLENQDNCGYGYGVFNDGIYYQTSKIISTYFENQEGIKIYFKDIK
jgi:hypothetical protein